MKKALLLIDIQNDFLPGGTLAVPNGDEVVTVANRMMSKFDTIIATQDWHPANHGSFASQYQGKKCGELILLNGVPQILWPDHCIQHTYGAEFAPNLDINKISKIIPKGMLQNVDSYSGFFDNNHTSSTGLQQFLQEQNIEDLTLLGLATDYCVKFTAIDASNLGLKVSLLLEGVRGVELQPGDCEKAITQMQMAGVHIIT